MADSTLLDLPDIRSSYGDSSAVAALYAVAEYFGAEPDIGGGFEHLLEVGQVRDAHPEEVEKAARNLGLHVKSGMMGAEAVRKAVEAGVPVLCVAGSGEYGVVVGIEKANPVPHHLVIHDPARGLLHVPTSAWASLYHGWGMVLDDPSVKKKYVIEKEWEEGAHPRGGDPKNPGRFSAGRGSGTADQPTKRPEELPEPEQPTRQTAGDADVAQRRESSAHTPSSAADKSPLHKAMEQSPVKRADPLGAGMNDATLLTLQDGTEAVFKTPAGENPEAGRAGVPPRTQYRREIAASRVADLLGFGDLVPTTTVRDQGGDVGSAQHYARGAEDASNADEPFDGPEDAARAAAFDYLIGHLDRHQGNWLVKDGKLVLIDNGLSLPTAYHEKDFFNMEFWKFVSAKDTPMPDLSGWADKWEAVETELKSAGIEDEAIALAKDRFENLTYPRYDYFHELPSLLDRGEDIRQMSNYYDKATRKRRMMKELADNLARNLERDNAR